MDHIILIIDCWYVVVVVVAVVVVVVVWIPLSILLIYWHVVVAVWITVSLLVTDWHVIVAVVVVGVVYIYTLISWEYVYWCHDTVVICLYLPFPTSVINVILFIIINYLVYIPTLLLSSPLQFCVPLPALIVTCHNCLPVFLLPIISWCLFVNDNDNNSDDAQSII